MAGKSSMNGAQYQAIVTAYREAGNNAAQIARITGRNRDTIGKALRFGWPELGFPPVHQPHRTAVSGAPGSASAATGTSPATPAGTSPATGPDGLTSKQSTARRQEEDAIGAGIQNLVGSGIVTTKILQKLIEQAPSILSKIVGTGDDAISPREYVRLIRELSKVIRESSDALNRLQAAGRLNTGEAGAITEHRHTGNVGVSVDVTYRLAPARPDRGRDLMWRAPAPTRRP
jgi:hypothetical protein